jgi:hypothetical protein
MAMLQSSTVGERILYWLSLDTQVRALAERHLERFAVIVGDLPASAARWTGRHRCVNFSKAKISLFPRDHFSRPDEDV